MRKPFSFEHLGDSDRVEIQSKCQMGFHSHYREKIGPDSTENPSVHQKCDFSVVKCTSSDIQVCYSLKWQGIGTHNYWTGPLNPCEAGNTNYSKLSNQAKTVNVRRWLKYIFLKLELIVIHYILRKQRHLISGRLFSKSWQRNNTFMQIPTVTETFSLFHCFGRLPSMCQCGAQQAQFILENTWQK